MWTGHSSARLLLKFKECGQLFVRPNDISLAVARCASTAKTVARGTPVSVLGWPELMPSSPRLQSSLAAMAGSENCRAVALAKADRHELRYNSAASYDSACPKKDSSMSRFVYVYILQSEANPDRFYIGCARDLRERLRRRNAGEVLHTAK